MLASYALGLTAIVIMTLAWVGIQSAWRKAFPGVFRDPDVLAGRTDCHRSDCTEDCDRRRPDRAASGKEDSR